MADFHRPPTAQEAVLGELRARILTGALRPGTPLRQEDLAASLGVSRVPVREALRMLESEGHVEYAPHRGYRVRVLSLSDLEEIYHLRAVLEDGLARAALSEMDPGGQQEVRAAYARLSQAERACAGAGGSGQQELAEANRRFHWAIVRPGPRAERILTTLWDASDAYRARWFQDPGNVAEGARAHARIMAAVEAGDVEALLRELAEHRRATVAALAATTPPAAAATG